jgi:Kef-type K+ transport system membrane component KefB
VFGIGESIATRWNDGTMRVHLLQGAIRIGVCLALALAASYLIREGLRLAGRDRDHQLVVFLGVVALVAGVAMQFGAPTIFAAMLVGVVVANMQGVDLRQFERFILKAEHVIAAMFALLAGVLLDVRIGAPEIALALAIAAARLLFKPAHFRWWARRSDAQTPGVEAAPLPSDSALYVGPVRQSPLAVALAVSFVLMEDRSALSTRLLTIIAIAGFLSDLLPLSASIARHGLRRRSSQGEGPEAPPEIAGATP